MGNGPGSFAVTEIAFEPAIPILRVYDIPKALEFYVECLGFTLDWQHQFEPDMPLYMQVSHGDLKLHLSEHYGDGTPGTAVYIRTTGARAFFARLKAKRARFARPGANHDEATLTDPFGNILRFDGSKRGEGT
jgi:catechol 2,3-dioxygenase-like lactoylglutathione lyase family enzyme